MEQVEFKADEPLEHLIDSKHEIFTARSPVDIVDPIKESPSPLPRKKFGRLAEIAFSRIQPLVDSRDTLNKVYSKGYFENHYPEADRSLKELLHSQTMQAWANAENPSSEVLQSKSEGKSLGDRPVIQLHFNLGA
jgi:hypothetical protein